MLHPEGLSPSPAAPSGGGAPRSTPLLDPQETTVDPPSRSPAPPPVLAGPARRARTRIVEALWLPSTDDLTRSARTIALCCSGAAIYTLNTGETRLAPASCRHRCCPHCQAERGRRVAARVAKLTEGNRQLRFLTLTLKSDGAALGDRVSRLLASFRKLRQTKLWRSSVQAAVAVVETTRGKDGQHWHTHLHVIASGTYIPQPKLSECWLKATGDSYIVHVRKVSDHVQAARYVGKYIGKQNELTKWDGPTICDYAREMKGRRLLLVTGKWGTTVVDSKPDDGEPPHAVARYTIAHLKAYAAEGIEAAHRALRGLAWLSPTWRQITGVAPPDKPPPQGEDRAHALRIIGELCAQARAEVNEREPNSRWVTLGMEGTSLERKRDGPQTEKQT